MARVHGLQHVEGFAATNLADDDPVGTHAQRVLHQFALGDFPFSLDVRGPRFQSRDVRLLKLQLRRILDGHDAFGVADEGRHRVEQGRFAAARAAGDQHVQPAAHDGLNEFGDLGRERAELDHFFDVDRDFRELADGQKRPVDGQWRNDGIDAGPILEPGIDHRLRFVDPAPDARNDLVDNPEQVPVVLELDRRVLQFPVAFHVDLAIGVHKDVRHGRILEQRLNGTKAEQFVQNVGRQLVAFIEAQRNLFFGQKIPDHFAHFAAELVAWHFIDDAEIHNIEQALMQVDLGLDEFSLGVLVLL